jgi:hypothetical protein
MATILFWPVKRPCAESRQRALPARALVMLLVLVGCPKPESTRSPIYRCLKVGDPRSSVKIGTLLKFSNEEFVVISDGDGARLKIDAAWVRPDGCRSFLLSGGELANVCAVFLSSDVSVSENGQRLGVFEELQGDAREVAERTLDSLPTMESTVERVKICLREFSMLLPQDDSLAKIDPETWTSTAPSRGILRMAQNQLWQACQPVPKSCAWEPLSHQEEDERIKADKRCEKKAQSQ